VILPRADAGCGKAFYLDRRTAEWHRIALEFWNQANGRGRADCRLSVYRCNRCGGFHVGQKRVASPVDSGESPAHSSAPKKASDERDSSLRRRRCRSDAAGSPEVTE